MSDVTDDHLGYLNDVLRFHIKYPDFSPYLKFPKWSEIFEKYENIPFTNFVSEEGLFSSDFLEFFFQYNQTLKSLINRMDERHHYLIHCYLHFLP